MHLHTHICNEILQVGNSQGHFISILIWLLENYKYLSNVATGDQDDCTSAFQWGSLFIQMYHTVINSLGVTFSSHVWYPDLRSSVFCFDICSILRELSLKVIKLFNLLNYKNWSLKNYVENGSLDSFPRFSISGNNAG